MKEKRKATGGVVREVKGNLRFPLDKTYHGCPSIFLPGLLFCPECLRGDPQPYFRKIWRLSLSTVCPTHCCYLHDRCPQCSTPLTPYIACRNGQMTDCYKCGRSLLPDQAWLSAVPDELVSVTKHLLKILDDGIVMIGGSPVYSHLYFRVLHHILQLMMNRKWGDRLCDDARPELSGSLTKMFERMSIFDQAKLIERAVWLLNEWPERFVDVRLTCPVESVAVSIRPAMS